MFRRTEPLDPVQRYYRRQYWQRRGLFLAALFLIGALIYWGIFAEVPADYREDDEHFKYGSIGSDSGGGLPYWIWRVLPEMFPEHLPHPKAFQALPEERQKGLVGYEQQFGFLFEEGMDRPIGFSKRRDPVDLVGLNCAVCHTSTLRVTEGMDPGRIYNQPPDYVADRRGTDEAGNRVLILGMPANTVNLGAYFQFLFDCAVDGRFTINNIMAHIASKTDLGPIEEFLYRRAIPELRSALLERREKLHFIEEVPAFGPGRVDTFNPYKAVQFGFPVDRTIGTADFPSIWNQRPREGMHLHWDGNNTSVFERNISASIGAGATPVTLDMPRMLRVGDWIGSPDPHQPMDEAEVEKARAHPYPRSGELPIPRYPFEIDESLAARGEKIYHEKSLEGGYTCATCHAWQGEQVGKVVPIEEIGTDPHRLNSFTVKLAHNQNTLGAGHWWRFHHFRKTDGYANMPLDGIWARAPYLHNGSVPTLRDLLERPENRPTTFYRGDDRYDPEKVGFRSGQPVSADGRELFKFDTTLPGNGNGGHLYGTGLSEADKEALVEYMKTIGPRPQEGKAYE